MAAKTTLRGTTLRGTTFRRTTCILAAPGDSFAPAVLRLRPPFVASYKVTWAEIEVPEAGTPPAGTQIKYWTGAAWVAKPLKRWTGSTWEAAALKRWNGSTWITA